MKKLLKYGLALGVLGALSVWLFVFILPKKNWWNDMWQKNGGQYKATQIVEDFAKNEDSARIKYPDSKAIDVEGTIVDKKVSENNLHIVLKGNEMDGNIDFVMRDSIINTTIGNNVILRGKCSGKLEDVLFNDGILIK